MGTRPILQGLKIFQVFFPVPVQVQCERFLLKPYNPFFQVPVLTLGRTALLLLSATKLRPVNVFIPVCHSVHRGESAIAPLGRHPLWADTPPAHTLPGSHPPVYSACWDTVNKRAVRILLECNLIADVMGFISINCRSI